jgi:hypothetical protein
MKYTLAIIALLGLVSAEEINSQIEKPKAKQAVHAQADADSDADAESSDSDSDTDSDSDSDGSSSASDADDKSGKTLLELGSDDDSDAEVDEESDSDSDDSSDSKSSGSSDSAADVQLEGDDDVDHSGEFFKSTEHDKLGDGGYKRVTTPRFAADSDDIFMRSMIEQYALEGKNKDGSPNGQFWMDEANSRAAALEVLGTHKNLKAAELDSYVKTYFPRTWAHFDVNRSGKVEVSKMPQFMRFIASDQQMYLW